MTPTIAHTTALSLLFILSNSPARRTLISLPDAGQPRTPVLVELFTSEGCSSCPPADDLLASLERQQPVSGAEIITLSEHVDYWNRLGWIDSFSSPEFSARQSRYAEIFKRDGVYTPQMIVDGQAEFVGSDVSRASEAIARVSQIRKASVEIARTVNENGNGPGSIALLSIRIERIPSPHRGLQVLLAVTEGNLQSQVSRGENAGRKLSHSSVVRKIHPIGTIATGAAGLSAEAKVPIEKKWKRQDLRAVVFVQERETGRVLGARAVALAE